MYEMYWEKRTEINDFPKQYLIKTKKTFCQFSQEFSGCSNWSVGV